VNGSIPEGTIEGYEALRRQVLEPGERKAPMQGWAMLVRRGLARWAVLWCTTASAPRCVPGLPSLCCASPVPSEIRSELARLLASLILSPIKENRYA
jgi:hypothetical protein